MKALSVQQPWAHLISSGFKLYEVRSRRDLDDLACVPTDGLWCWELRNPQRVEPFPVKGRLGFFDVELPDGVSVSKGAN